MLIQRTTAIYVFLVFIISELEAAWTLTGSSEFAVAGESFTLTCDPKNSSAVSVLWKRLDIDTTAAGTNRASVDANACKIGNGSDTQYQYTCEPGPVYKLTIPANVMTNSQNNKIWRCESFFGGAVAAAKYKVKVQVPVSSVSIQADNAVNVIYDNVPKTFYCITNGCRPKANVTVTTTGVNKGQLTESTIPQNGDLIITRVSQVITANREGSAAKTLQCSAVNIQGRQPVKSQLITLDVYYKPIITLDTTDIIVQEGDNLSRQCSAIGNPTPTVKWFRGSSELTSGTETSAALMFSNIDRNHADTYQCKATTGKMNFESSKSLSVVVYYPPVITVSLQNKTENATDVVFTCNAADGFPTNYTYHGWYQYIGSTIVRSKTDFTGMLSESNRKITIFKATFEDIGRYHCVVENGFHGRNPNVLQQGSSYFDVKVSAKFEPEEEARKPGELHKNFTTNIKFFSNPPALISGIKWINKTSIRNPLTDSDSISIKLMSIAMQRLVYGKVVTLTGQSAMLTITSLQSFHLGYYQLQIHNGENLSSSFNFHIISSAPPEAPSEFSSAENGTKFVILTWKRGFNGGHEQTFVIRYTNIETRETKETTIKDTNQGSYYTKVIDGLEPSTTYHFWIYSTNEKGNSTLSGNLIVQTLKELERKSDKLGAIAGGVTGILVAIIISLVIGGVIFYRRRTQGTKRNASRQNGKFPLTARSQSDEDDGMRNNVLYEPSEPNIVKAGECGDAITGISGGPSDGASGGASGGQNDYLYADVQKNGKRKLNNPIPVDVEEHKIPKNVKKPDPSAMYTDVQKPKQEEKEGKGGATPKKLLKKSKEKKLKPGTLYENMDDIKAQEKDDERKKPKGPKTKTKPNKNKGGLIYADILHESKPNGESRLVIHGLENKTDYAEVDFSRSGKQLPPDNSQTDKQKQQNK